MRVSHWPHGRITSGREVKRQKTLLSELQVIESSQFHDEVVRMLPIGNRNSESRFALLEEQRIPPVGHGRRFQAQHRARSEYAWAELSLRHRHEPASRKELVFDSRTRLLLIENEHVRVEHKHPRAFHHHEHWHGSRDGLRTRTRTGVAQNGLHKIFRHHIHRAATVLHILSLWLRTPRHFHSSHASFLLISGLLRVVW